MARLNATSPLPDRELIEACRLRGWERRLHDLVWSGWGCAGSLLVPAVLVVAGHLAVRDRVPHNADLYLFIPVALWLAGIIFLSLSSVCTRRRRRYWKELQRRYAGAGIKAYVRQAESEAASDTGAAPNLVVILSGAALPHGGNWLVIVRLWPNQTGTVEVRTLSFAFASTHDADRIEMQTARITLSASECARVVETIAGLRTSRRSRFPSTVMDGAPASLALWERGSGVIGTATCNLAGVPSKHEEHPAVRLMRLTAELARKAPSHVPNLRLVQRDDRRHRNQPGLIPRQCTAPSSRASEDR